MKIKIDFKHDLENIKKLTNFEAMYSVVNVSFYKLTKIKIFMFTCSSLII